MRHLSVYLAGPIFRRTDAECIDWRKRVAALLETMLVDPMARDERGHEERHFRGIIEADKADLDEAWAVLACCWTPSFGTPMEILYAWERGKTIVVVAPKPWSPWLRYHSHFITESLEDACSWLNAESDYVRSSMLARVRGLR